MTTDTEMVQKIRTKVWVLVIDHKHGTNASAHPSRADLDAALYDYCDEGWSNAFSEDRPAPEFLVRDYWDKMSARGDEWHVIEECELPATDELGPRLDRALDDNEQLRAEVERLRGQSVADRPAVSAKRMNLSDGRCDYFVSIKVGDREVTPHVFREEYKSAYHVALYDWLLNGTEKPNLVAFGPDDWPARVQAPASDGFASGLAKAMEVISNMRQSGAANFGDPKYAGQRGQDRSDALYDAYRAICALSKRS